MSEAAKLSGAGDTFTWPNHTIGPYRARHFGEAELYLESRHLEAAHRAAAKLPPADAERLIRKAHDAVESGHFRFDMPGFRAGAFSDSDFPVFLRLALNATEPGLTVDEAEDLFNALPPEQQEKVRWAVLAAMRYEVKPPQAKEGEPKNADAPR